MKLNNDNSVRRTTRFERNLSGWFAYVGQIEDRPFEDLVHEAMLRYYHQHQGLYPNGPTVPELEIAPAET